MVSVTFKDALLHTSVKKECSCSNINRRGTLLSAAFLFFFPIPFFLSSSSSFFLPEFARDAAISDMNGWAAPAAAAAAPAATGAFRDNLVATAAATVPADWLAGWVVT